MTRHLAGHPRTRQLAGHAPTRRFFARARAASALLVGLSFPTLSSLLFTASVSIVAPVDAHATTFAPMTIEQFTDASTFILEGKVLEVWTEIDPQNDLVWTRSRIQVSSVHKGANRPTELVVDSAGGKVGDYQVYVPGMAEFSVGEEVFLFLDELASGRFVPVSMFQGKYTIRRAPGETRNHVMNWHGSRSVPFDARFLPHPPKESRVYLDDLRKAVTARLSVGWDGQPIGGITQERLQKLNTLDRRLPR